MISSNRFADNQPDYALIQQTFLTAAFAHTSHADHTLTKKDLKLDSSVMFNMLGRLDVKNSADQMKLMLIARAFLNIDAPWWQTLLKSCIARIDKKKSVKELAKLMFGDDNWREFHAQLATELNDDKLLPCLAEFACSKILYDRKRIDFWIQRLEVVAKANFLFATYLEQWWTPSHIDFALLHAATIKGIKSYLQTEFKTSNLSFGIFMRTASGATGRERGEIVLALLEGLNPDKTQDQYMLVLVLTELVHSTARRLLLFIISEIAAQDPSHKLCAGMDLVFGVRSCADLLNTLLEKFGDNERRIIRNTLDLPFVFKDDEAHPIYFGLKIVAREFLSIFLHTFLNKEIEDVYPHLENDRKSIRLFLSGKISIEKLNEFLARPGSSSYFDILPLDVRREVGKHISHVNRRT